MGWRLWKSVWQCGLRTYSYQQHNTVSLALIHGKAISLHEAEEEKLEEAEAAEVKQFAASRGWFHHFPKCMTSKVLNSGEGGQCRFRRKCLNN
jgi:hypothetical protein